jgi:hypothetical protein
MAPTRYRLDMRDDNAEKTIGFESIPSDSIIHASMEAWSQAVSDGTAVDVTWKLHDGQRIIRYGWRDGAQCWQGGDR